MKNLNKNIMLLLTGILMFSMPMMAQNGSTSKELAKQEKKLRKKNNECEKNNGVITIAFRKEACCVSYQQEERSRNKITKWAKNNEIILNNMPDIIYMGSKMNDYSGGPYLVYIYEYRLIPLQESNVFPNQTISFSDMNKQGAGVLYADMTHRRDRIGNRMKKTFYQFPQINWSGEIRNGSIDGEGEGYVYKDGILYFVKGKFNSGKPEGSCAFSEFIVKNNNLRHTDVKVGSFNGGFAQMTKSDEEGKVLYVDNNFSIFDLKERVAHLYYENKHKLHRGSWSQSTLESFADNKVVVASTFIARDGHLDTDQILDSIRLELFMNTNGDFAGLTENGKQSIREYYNSIIPIAENLSKVFNAQEVNNPSNNLKTHYGFDIQQLKNKLTTIEHLPEDIPQADSIYKANPNISKRIDMGKDLYKLYEILDTDYTNPYHNNYLAPSSFMEDKAEDATRILDALMSNPLFPKKSQATVNVVKTKLKSMTNSYAQAWAKANKAETAKRRAQDDQNRKIDELVESYDIPRIVKTELFNGPAGGMYYYYQFEDGISGLVGFRDGNKYTVGTGGILLTVYKTIEDAKCALYFWEKYGRERRRGRLGY